MLMSDTHTQAHTDAHCWPTASAASAAPGAPQPERNPLWGLNGVLGVACEGQMAEKPSDQRGTGGSGVRGQN